MYNEKHTKRYNAIPYTKTREGRKKLRLAEKLIKFTEYAQKVSRPDYPIFKTWDEITNHLRDEFDKVFKNELKGQERLNLYCWFNGHINDYDQCWRDIPYDYWDTVKGCVVWRYFDQY